MTQCKLPCFILPWDRFSRQSQRIVHHHLQWAERPISQSLLLITSFRSKYTLSTANMQMQPRKLRMATRTAATVANIRLLQATQIARGNRLQQERDTRRANPTLHPRGHTRPRLVAGNLCLPTKPTERADDRTQSVINPDKLDI